MPSGDCANELLIVSLVQMYPQSSSKRTLAAIRNSIAQSPEGKLSTHSMKMFFNKKKLPKALVDLCKKKDLSEDFKEFLRIILNDVSSQITSLHTPLILQ